MKRVFQLSYTLALAGTETVIMNWYRNIDRDKLQFDFGVVSLENSYFSDEINNKGGRIFLIPKKSGAYGILKFLFGIYKTLKENGPYEAFHTHDHFLCGFSCMAAWAAGVKKRFVISHYSQGTLAPISKIKRFLSKLFIRLFATECFAVSEEAGFYLYGDMPFKILNNGIDLDKFKFKPKIRSEKRKELKCEGKILFGNAGRLTEEKNQSFVLEVFSHILRKEPNSVLIIIGVGPLRDKLLDKTEKLNLGNSVKFLGNRSDIVECYQAMDCFVFPSIYEGLGIVAVEAQACGLPCFISDAVPDEAKIVNTEKLPLSLGAEKWADCILEKLKYFERKNESLTVAEAGFDIKLIAKEIQAEYLKD